MNTRELHKYAGSLQQLLYARPISYREGRTAQMQSIEVKCGDLFFHVSPDKCLDVTDLCFRGMNMTFLSKGGLIGRTNMDTNGEEALRSIMGGLFFTCGLENICAPCKVNGHDYPMHGRIRTTPAEHVGIRVIEEDEGASIVISGEMREAELFGENMVLRREIITRLNENSIEVLDEIENQSFREEPMMILYHCNMGYPFLREGSEIYVPTAKVTGREEHSEKHLQGWNRMDAPKDNELEYVYLHDIKSDDNKNTAVMVANRELETAIAIEYSTENLPYFMEWKSVASGDYVLGLEPANSSVYGKKYHLEKGTLHRMAPGAKEKNRLKFTVLSGNSSIDEMVKRINAIG
ncbi:MAG: aldose 1-epimerase family protein [Lachnospiraceae bacterium]|nr:aldose 1-epimerase family protein [Lachnospiraceae bacterium]